MGVKTDVTLRDDRTLRAFDNRVLMRIFESKIKIDSDKKYQNI
jgi:hypothetical protein